MYELSEDEDIDIIKSSGSEEENKYEGKGKEKLVDETARDVSPVKTQVSSKAVGMYLRTETRCFY